MDDELRQLDIKDYPEGLREIPGVPASLWLRGQLAPKGTMYLAVVGSRALSPYGKHMCESLIEGLKGYPISIVSGLALGADACAHRAALDAGLHTTAVLGSGVSDSAISPRSNFPLAKEILQSGGALISENAPDHTPFPSDFPKRNRIVAGLSQAVLIIEAGERSGTLITARLAGEYNRDLLCIPHRATDPGGYGAQLFIRLGAALVTKPEHILEVLGIRENSEPEDTLLSPTQQTLLDLLSEPASREELVEKSNLSHSDTISALAALELKGRAKERYGKWQRN